MLAAEACDDSAELRGDKQHIDANLPALLSKSEHQNSIISFQDEVVLSSYVVYGF
jgi:hypothetical protein